MSHLLSAEVQLILALHALDMYPAQPEDALGALQAIDWDKLLKIARRHKIQNATWELLKTHGADLVPRQAHREIEARKRRQHRRGMDRLLCMHLTKRILTDGSVPHLFMKGLLLSQVVHDDPFRRDFGDIDLWVPAHVLKDTCTLLEQHGFVRTFPPAEFSWQQLDLYRETRYHVTYQHKRYRTPIEVHWRLFESDRFFAVDFERAWAESQQVMLGSESFNFFGGATGFEYLIMHGAKHAWGRYKWLIDIGHIVMRPNGCFDNTLDDRQDPRTRRAKAVTHHLLNQLFALPFGEQAEGSATQDRTTAKLASACLTTQHHITSSNQYTDDAAWGGLRIPYVESLWQKSPLLKLEVLRNHLSRPEDAFLLGGRPFLKYVLFFVRPWAWLIRKLKRG